MGLWLRAHVIGLFENYLGAELISSICFVLYVKVLG
ncbi:hypothetical protein BN187_490001 [Clostridioides difficile E12]|nr:hypothetical protein BN187_490001 [Clostridioides difficile E12]CCL94422.1 hypothetical protein BN191_320011 [Clostridioides difficile T61]